MSGGNMMKKITAFIAVLVFAVAQGYSATNWNQNVQVSSTTKRFVDSAVVSSNSLAVLGVPNNFVGTQTFYAVTIGGVTRTNWPTGVVTEVDPVFTNWASTNTYVKMEIDPVFTNWLGTNTYLKGGSTNYVTGFAMSGADALIETNSKGFFRVPTSGTITQWVLRADAPSTTVILIEKGSADVFPAVSSIVAAAPVIISAQRCVTNTTLTGWTKTVTAGDYLKYTVLTNTAATNLAIEIKVNVP